MLLFCKWANRITWKGDLRKKELRPPDLWVISHLHPAAVPLTIPVGSYFLAMALKDFTHLCLVSVRDKQKALLQTGRSPSGFTAISTSCRLCRVSCVKPGMMAGSVLTAQGLWMDLWWDFPVQGLAPSNSFNLKVSFIYSGIRAL